MFFGLKISLRPVGDHTPRRRERRCIPSLSGPASCLEDRVLLSGAGEKAHAAEVAHPAARNLANTHAGQVVTGLFESVVGTGPTSAQLTNWVHKLQSGVSANTLRKDLVATTRSPRMQQPAPTVMDVVSHSDATPTSSSTTNGASSAMTVSSSAMLAAAMVNTMPSPTNLAAVGLHVQQAPNMSALRAGIGGGSGSGASTGSGGGGGTTSSLLSSSTSTSTSTSMSNTGSMGMASSSMTGTTTPGMITSSGQLPLSQLPLSQLPMSQLPMSQLPMSQLPMSQLPMSQLPMSQLPVTPV